jgi:hypothetical protein
VYLHISIAELSESKVGSTDFLGKYRIEIKQRTECHQWQGSYAVACKENKATYINDGLSQTLLNTKRSEIVSTDAISILVYFDAHAK